MGYDCAILIEDHPRLVHVRVCIASSEEDCSTRAVRAARLAWLSAAQRTSKGISTLGGSGTGHAATVDNRDVHRTSLAGGNETPGAENALKFTRLGMVHPATESHDAIGVDRHAVVVVSSRTIMLRHRRRSGAGEFASITPFRILDALSQSVGVSCRACDPPSPEGMPVQFLRKPPCQHALGGITGTKRLHVFRIQSLNPQESRSIGDTNPSLGS